MEDAVTLFDSVNSIRIINSFFIRRNLIVVMIDTGFIPHHFQQLSYFGYEAIPNRCLPEAERRFAVFAE